MTAPAGQLRRALPREIESDVAPGVRVAVHECTKPVGSWSTLEVHETYGLVFVSRGGFRRRAAGREHYIGPGTAFFEQLGAADEVLHPHASGDTTSIFALSEQAIDQFVGGCELSYEPIATQGPIDYAHHRLVAALRIGIDRFEAEERFAQLFGVLLHQAQPGRLTVRRPATDRAHDRIVDT